MTGPKGTKNIDYFSLDICGISFGNCCQIHDMLSEDFPLNYNPGTIDNFMGEYLQGWVVALVTWLGVSVSQNYCKV